MDVRPLLRGFDLHAFDQFMDAEDYETRLKAAMAQRTLRSAAEAAAGENAAGARFMPLRWGKAASLMALAIFTVLQRLQQVA